MHSAELNALKVPADFAAVAMGYAFQGYDVKTMARVKGTSMPVSDKDLREIGMTIKGMAVEKAIKYLERVTNLEQAVPYTRYNKKQTHKKGVAGPANYPVFAVKRVISLLELVKNCAQQKGLGTAALTVIHTSAQRGPAAFHRTQRRNAGHRRKNSHFELVAAEVAQSKENKKGAKQ